MRINNNINSLISTNYLSNINKNIINTLEDISDGKKINKASDNSASIVISDNLRTQINSARSLSEI